MIDQEDIIVVVKISLKTTIRRKNRGLFYGKQVQDI